jgi:hypothetical protein
MGTRNSLLSAGLALLTIGAMTGQPTGARLDESSPRDNTPIIIVTSPITLPTGTTAGDGGDAISDAPNAGRYLLSQPIGLE